MYCTNETTRTHLQSATREYREFFEKQVLSFVCHLFLLKEEDIRCLPLSLVETARGCKT